MASPPFFKILSLAPAVNLKAAIVAFGNSNNLLSSVTVPTTTMVFQQHLFFKALEILETETGGLLILDKNKDFKMTLLNGASVRPKIKDIVSTVFHITSAQKTHNIHLKSDKVLAEWFRTINIYDSRIGK